MKGVSIDQLKEDLAEVLDYNWKDELRDYLDHRGEPTHIFNRLARLDGFVYGHNKTAEHFAKEATKGLKEVK